MSWKKKPFGPYYVCDMCDESMNCKEISDLHFWPGKKNLKNVNLELAEAELEIDNIEDLFEDMSDDPDWVCSECLLEFGQSAYHDKLMTGPEFLAKFDPASKETQAAIFGKGKYVVREQVLMNGKHVWNDFGILPKDTRDEIFKELLEGGYLAQRGRVFRITKEFTFSREIDIIIGGGPSTAPDI